MVKSNLVKNKAQRACPLPPQMVLWMTKDGGRAEFSLEAFEGFVAAGIPEQGLGLPAEQGGKQGCEQTETLDETVIEIGESMESLEFLNRLGSRPFSEFP